MKKRNYIFGVLALIWMIIIFSFSARPSDVSTNDSNRIGMMIGNLCVSGFKEWPKEKQMEFAKKIDHPIRKSAHAMEYTILGSFVASAVIIGKRKAMLNFLIPWGIGALYAATDEFHQLFVPGRSGQVSDVMLDSSGVFLGVLIVFLILRKTAKRHSI